MRKGAAGLLLGLLPATALAGNDTDLSLLPFARERGQLTGSVENAAWVERTGDGFELVVTLEPRGAAKLVADPGITVRPTPAPGIDWQRDELSLVDGTRDYFATPQVLRLPFKGTAESVAANVEYAWCIKDYQCLFGEAELSASVP